MIITQIESAFETQVTQLFKETFWHLCLSEEVSLEHAKPLLRAMEKRTVLTALDPDKNLLGFGFFNVSGEDSGTAAYLGAKL